MRWPFGPPHLTLKPSKKRTKTKTNKEGLGPSEVALRPPHLTLKPSKKTTKNKNKNKMKKMKRMKKKGKRTRQTKKWAFQLSVMIFFFGGVSRNSFFLTTWPRKRAPPKHYKIGVSAYQFLKNSYGSRNGHFWTKKPKSRNSSYHFFWLFSSLSITKNTKICWNPIFIVF